MADEELSAKLRRRQTLNESGSVDDSNKKRIFNPYTDFPEFSRKEIKEYEKTFKKFDVGKDNFIDFEELKRMMENLGAPQTHLALKEMIAEIDEDNDNKISFREFLLIFHKAKAGELLTDSGLSQLASLTEIDVEKEGVGGAKNFFEAKIEEQSRGKKFEEEIRAEQEEKRKQEEERRQRKEAFKHKARFFEQAAAS